MPRVSSLLCSIINRLRRSVSCLWSILAIFLTRLLADLRKFVLVNKEILITLRTIFDKLGIMKKLFKRQGNEELKEQIPFLTFSILRRI